ncbi:energy transducer TonB [Motiliproteus sediminis]|uniref:energy transducer TonB n=1 Tax=Motiliproteus sediminis TaxID=1468178 RepID=UPI001AEFDFCB|nr:TonB family protein [Motiliproteus sediminis]
MTGRARFFGLLLVSAGAHAAALFGLGWNTPAPSGDGGPLRVTLSGPSAALAVPAAMPPAPVSALAHRKPAVAKALPEKLVTRAVHAQKQVASPQPVAVVATPVKALTPFDPKPDATDRVTVAKVGKAAARVEAVATSAVLEDSSPVSPAARLADAGGAAEPATHGSEDHRTLAGRQLLAALQDHFSYPLRARRKGWEGDVLLGVDLDEGGMIAEVRLLASSGYGALDRAAMASMRAVGALERSLAARLTVEVPVRYRLIN